jgi:hypothetical protein
VDEEAVLMVVKGLFAVESDAECCRPVVDECR